MNANGRVFISYAHRNDAAWTGQLAVTRGLRASANPAAIAYFLAAMAWSTVW